VGDGIADDTGAVQNAVNALYNLVLGPPEKRDGGGGVIYFPKGVYRMMSTGTGTLYFPDGNPGPNAAIRITGSNITLQGEGRGSIIQQDGNTKSFDERPWTIPFFFFFGNLIAGSEDQFPEFNTGNILIKDLTFRGSISPKLMPLGLGVGGISATGIGAFLAFEGVPRRFTRGIRIVSCEFEDGFKSNPVCPRFTDDLQFENCLHDISTLFCGPPARPNQPPVPP